MTAKPSAIELLTCPFCNGAFHHFVWASAVPGVEREKIARELIHRFEMESMALHKDQREWLVREILALIEQTPHE